MLPQGVAANTGTQSVVKRKVVLHVDVMPIVCLPFPELSWLHGLELGTPGERKGGGNQNQQECYILGGEQQVTDISGASQHRVS